MTHKLIKTQNYLLVVDDSEIKEGDTIYEDMSGIFSPYEKGDVVENPKKIIAHLPLNGAPILEGVDLLPPYSRHQEDGLDELAQEWVFDINGHKWSNNDDTGGDNYGSFKAGYNKAREKYKYTKEDMRKAISHAYKQARPDTEYEPSPLFYQYPTEFISDDEISHQGSGTYSTDLMDIGVSNLKPIKVPKTITTAQGVQWVGRYK